MTIVTMIVTEAVVMVQEAKQLRTQMSLMKLLNTVHLKIRIMISTNLMRMEDQVTK